MRIILLMIGSQENIWDGSAPRNLSKPCIRLFWRSRVWMRSVGLDDEIFLSMSSQLLRSKPAPCPRWRCRLLPSCEGSN